MMQAEHLNGVCKLRISGELTIYTAKECRQHLLHNLALCREMEIDLSGVTEIDSAGLQLLIQAQREESIRDLRVRLDPLNASIADVLQMLGLEISSGVLSCRVPGEEGSA